MYIVPHDADRCHLPTSVSEGPGSLFLALTPENSGSAQRTGTRYTCSQHQLHEVAVKGKRSSWKDFPCIVLDAQAHGGTIWVCSKTNSQAGRAS